MAKPRFIGFKPDTLTQKPLRLEVFHAQEGLIVLDKPLDILIDAHPWYPNASAIIPALSKQLKKQKPELAQYNISTPQAIVHFEPYIPALALIATNRDAVEHYRNLMGSHKLEFVFKILIQGNVFEVGEERFCDLPLAKNEVRREMRVSHKNGKTTETSFKCLEIVGKYSYWEARTSYYRLHQIAIHAKESGLPLVGDPVYSKIRPICLSSFIALNKPTEFENPIYSGSCVDLLHVHGLLPDNQPISKAPHNKLQVLDAKLRKYSL